MIRSFRNKELQKSWEYGKSFAHKKLSAQEIFYILDALNSASAPVDVAFFGRFFDWVENGRNRYGVAITDHWTVTFGWSDGHAESVDLEWNN